MTLSIDRFKNVIISPARPTLFKIQLNFPDGNNEEIDTVFCKGAQIPSADVGIIELSYMGRKAKYAGDKTFTDWTVTIYNDTNFTIRRKIESWSEILNSTKGNLSSTNWNNYQRNIKIFHYDGDNKVIKEYTLINAFPINTGDPIDLGWDQNDTAEEYSVTFAYDYFTTDVTK